VSAERTEKGLFSLIKSAAVSYLSTRLSDGRGKNLLVTKRGNSDPYEADHV